MPDWFYHLLGLKSPREMNQVYEEYRKELVRLNLDIAKSLAETLTGVEREKALAQIAEAAKRMGVE